MAVAPEGDPDRGSQRRLLGGHNVVIASDDLIPLRSNVVSDTTAGRHQDGGERRPWIEPPPDHDASFGPGVGRLNAIDPGGDRPIAFELLIDEVEFVRRAGDIGAAADDGVDAGSFVVPAAARQRLGLGDLPQLSGAVGLPSAFELGSERSGIAGLLLRRGAGQGPG